MKLLSCLTAAAIFTAGLSAQCFTDPLGVPQGAGDDSISTLTLGFPFPFPGGTSTANIDVDSNGRILPGGLGAVSDFTDDPAEHLMQEALTPFWDDLTFTGTADDLYFFTDAMRAVIQWNQVRFFGGTDLFDFTVILNANGDFRYEYSNNFNITNADAIVGYSDGVSADPGESDFSTAVGGAILAGGTAYEYFNIEPWDIGASTGASFDFFSSMPGYTIIGTDCMLPPPPPSADILDLANGCNFANPPGPGQSISWFSDAMGGYSVVPNTGIAFDTNIGTSVAPTDDSISTVALGFSFTLPGGTVVTDIDIDSNGRIMQVGADASDFTPTLGENLAALGAVIMPFHVDLNANNGGDVSFFTDNTSIANITWDSPQFGAPAGQNLRFQLQLDGMSDSWSVVYDDVTNYSTSSSVFGNDILIGCTEGNGAADPGETDVTAGVVTMGNPNQYELFDDAIPEDQDLQTGGGIEASDLTAITLPQVGTSFDLQLDGVPATAFQAVIGFGSVDLMAPLSLISTGNPCTLNSSLDLFTVGATVGGTTNFSIDLTGAGPGVLGIQLVIQGVIADLTRPQLGMIPVATSNALIATIGV